jgi:hypothetical protein
VEPLAERAPRLGGEAERDPVVAGVRVAGPTGRARPVAEAERDGDAVALADLLDLVADRDDDAGGFVPEDVPLRERPGLPERVVPPGVPVAPTDAARRGLDHAPLASASARRPACPPAAPRDRRTRPHASRHADRWRAA